MRAVIQKLKGRLDKIKKEIRWGKSQRTSGILRTCQNCRNRVVYYHSENESYFYIKCGLNKQVVNPSDFCHYFVLDPQNYEI